MNSPTRRVFYSQKEHTFSGLSEVDCHIQSTLVKKPDKDVFISGYNRIPYEPAQHWHMTNPQSRTQPQLLAPQMHRTPLSVLERTVEYIYLPRKSIVET
jgi:hypothetical protein